MEELYYVLCVFACGVLVGGLVSLSLWVEVRRLRRLVDWYRKPLEGSLMEWQVPPSHVNCRCVIGDEEEEDD